MFLESSQKSFTDEALLPFYHKTTHSTNMAYTRFSEIIQHGIDDATFCKENFHHHFGKITKFYAV